MGERLNYIIVDSEMTELYYGRWGAVTMDLDLVAGPEAALRRIRRFYRPTEVLLDRIWCEAAALIDLRQRVLALFTWHCDDYAHRAALHTVLATTWPGWDLRWAYGGIEEIAAYAGRKAEPHHRLDFSRILTAVDPTDPADLDECTLLVTVAEPNRPARAYAMWTDVNDAFWYGPALLGALPDSARITALPRLPDSGLHLDPAAQTMAGWITAELGGLARDWSRCWPGWRFEFHQDRYEFQLAHCGDQLSVPAPTLAAGLDVLGHRIDSEVSQPTCGRTPDEVEAARTSISRVSDLPHTLPRWPGLQIRHQSNVEV